MDASYERGPDESDSDTTTSGRRNHSPAAKRPRTGKSAGSSARGSHHGRKVHKSSGGIGGRGRGRSGSGSGSGSSGDLDRVVDSISRDIRSMIPQLQALRQRYNQMLVQQAMRPQAQPNQHVAAAVLPTPTPVLAASRSPLSTHVATVPSIPPGPPANVAPGSPVPPCKTQQEQQSHDTCVAHIPTTSHPATPSPASGRSIPVHLLQNITAAAAAAAAAAVAAADACPPRHGLEAGEADRRLAAARKHAAAGVNGQTYMVPAERQSQHVGIGLNPVAVVQGHTVPRGTAPDCAGSPGMADSHDYALFFRELSSEPRGACNSNLDPDDGMDAEEAAELFADFDSPKLSPIPPYSPAPVPMSGPPPMPEPTTAMLVPPPWKVQALPHHPMLHHPNALPSAMPGACSSAKARKLAQPSGPAGVGHAAASAMGTPCTGMVGARAMLEYQGSASSTLQSSISSTVQLRRELTAPDSDDEEHVLKGRPVPPAPGPTITAQEAYMVQQSHPHPFMAQVPWDESGMYAEAHAGLGMMPVMMHHPNARHLYLAHGVAGWDEGGACTGPANAYPVHGPVDMIDQHGAQYEYAYIDITLIDPDEM